MTRKCLCYQGEDTLLSRLPCRLSFLSGGCHGKHGHQQLKLSVRSLSPHEPQSFLDFNVYVGDINKYTPVIFILSKQITVLFICY